MNDLFPDPPLLHGNWAPIFIEPILQSGESIAVGVVARDEYGNVGKALAFNADVLRYIYGGQASGFMAFAEVALGSLERHVLSTGDFEGWVAPFKNATAGEPSPTMGDTLDDILRIGLRRTASFSVMLEKRIRETIAPPANRFLLDVRKLLLERDDYRFSVGFGKSFKVAEAARATTLDYWGTRTAVNFGRFNTLTRQGLAHSIKSAKVKLWDLDCFRHYKAIPRKQIDLVDGADESFKCELHLLFPHFDASHSSAEIEVGQAAFKEIEEEGDRHGLRVVKLDSPEASANRIFRAENGLSLNG